MNEILTEMQANGLDPHALILDGKLHRFKLDPKDTKESGWYIGFQNFSQKTGEKYCIAKYGDWKTGEEFTYKPTGVALTATDKAEVKKQIAKAQAAAEAEKQAAQLEASRLAVARWEQLSQDESIVPEYFEKKGITGQGLFGCRVSREMMGVTAHVPVRNVEGILMGLQRLQGDGGKFFMPGQQISGCFHEIGMLGDTVYICEGFATGASIHMALDGAGVVVAFNAGNLLPVALELKRRYPAKQFIICGDDDLWTRKKDGTVWNPGREKAEEAAKRVMGAVVFPKFKELVERQTTDFNDLHTREGLERLREQIKTTKVERVAVIPLGFRENEYFFTSTDNPQIVKMTTFADTQFYNLMRREYWEAAYPSRTEQGIDWNQAKSDMMSQARRRGIFESQNVRGAGIWIDEKRVVINMGDRLIVDGRTMAVNEISSRFFYTLGKRLPEMAEKPLTLDECGLITEMCETFKWTSPEAAKYAAGMIVIAKICGALPVRPHMWLTGSSSTGKSTFLERVVFPTLKGHSMYFLGGTSEAGLRQSLRADALPVIFDEFETMGGKSGDNILACIELMRSSWSESHGFIAKGSAGGTANMFQTRFSAIVSSIRPTLTNDADRSRFTVVELAPHGSDPEHWKRLEALLNRYNEEVIDRLFARTIKLLPTLMENYKRIKKALAQRVSSRFGQQYGMLLAGYSLLITDEILFEEEIDGLIDGLNLEEASQVARVSDQDECLSHLLNTKIRLDFSHEAESRLVGETLVLALMDSRYNDALQRYGVSRSGEFFYVASSHTELAKNVFKGTRWEHCWGTTLARLVGAEHGIRHRFLGRQQRTVKIPIELISQ